MIKRIAPLEWFLSITILLTLTVSACMPIQKNIETSFDVQADMTDTSIPTPIPSTTKTSLPTSTVTPSVTFSPTTTFTPTATPTPRIPAELSPLFNNDLAVIDSSNVTNLVELSQFGDGYLISVEVSADGTTAAAVFSIGVEVYNLQTMERQSVFYTSLKFDRSHFDYQLSPNGKYFVIAKYDQVEVWKTDDGSQKHQTLVTNENLSLDPWYRFSYPVIQFSPDNRSFSVNDNIVLRLFSTETGEMNIEKASISTTCFSTDGKYIAVVATRKGDLVEIYNTVTGDVDYSLKGPDGAVALAFSPGEDHLAVAYKNVIWVWDYQDNRLVNTLNGRNSTASPSKMVFTDDGHMLTYESVYDPIGIRLWDMTTGGQIINLSEHRYPVLSPDKTRLITFHSQSYHYYIWDLTTKIPLAKIDQGYHKEQVVYFLPDGKHVNIFYREPLCVDGLLPYAQYRLEDGSVTIEKRSDDTSGLKVHWCADYYHLNQNTNALITWTVERHKFRTNEFYPATMELRNPTNGLISHSIEFSFKSGRFQFFRMQEKGILDDWENLFSGDIDRFIRETAWGRYKGNDPRYMVNHRELNSPDNEYLVAQFGNDLIVRKISDEVETAKKSFIGYIIAFEFSAESDKIFLVHSPKGHEHTYETVSFWDFNTGFYNNITSYGSRLCENRPLSVSPDGKLLAMSGDNCIIRIISAINYNEEICSFSPSIGENGIMMFSPNSDLLATAFSGGEIQFWSTETCELVHAIFDHIDLDSKRPAVNFSFSPDGTLLGVSYGSWPEYPFDVRLYRHLGHEGGTISFWGINQ